MNIAIEKDTERLSELAESITDANDAELLELKIGVTKRGRNINLVIDSVGGVTIQTCAKISRGLEYKLMEEEYADGKFKIEVSSPGVDRPLSEEGDFRRKTGKKITLWHTDGVIDSPLEGVIKLVSNGVLSIETSKETVNINMENVDKAKLLVAIR